MEGLCREGSECCSLIVDWLEDTEGGRVGEENKDVLEALGSIQCRIY